MLINSVINMRAIFILILQVTCLYCAPMNFVSHESPQLPMQPFIPTAQMLRVPQIPPITEHEKMPRPIQSTITRQQDVQKPVDIPMIFGQQEIQQPLHWPMQPETIPQIVPGAQEMIEAENLALQQQMMALQQWQILQNLHTLHAPVPMAVTPPPFLVIIPNSQDFNEKELTKTAHNENELKHDTSHINEDSDSVIIESDQNDNEIEKHTRTILLVPNARFSIGDFIASIPWLPIEVNVPDTIAWGYNGISNWISTIISIIGQRFPFRRPQATSSVVKQINEMTPQNASLKIFLKKLQNKQALAMPVLVVPLGGTVPPFQIVD